MALLTFLLTAGVPGGVAAPGPGPASVPLAKGTSTSPGPLLASLAPADRAAVPPLALSTGGTILTSNNSIVPGNVQPWNLAVPLGLALNPSNQSVYVAGAFSGTLGRLNPDTGELYAGSDLQTYPTYPTGFGGGATALAYDPVDQRVYVGAPSAAEVVVADAVTGSPLTTVSLGAGSIPSAVVYDPASSQVFVADAATARVWIVSTASESVVGNVSVGAEPEALWLDVETEALFVANYASSNISVIDIASLNLSNPEVTSWIPVGSGPSGFAQVGADIWVLNQNSGNISVVNATTFASVRAIGLPSGSSGAATSLVYDPGTRVVYALNAPSGDLAVLNATTGAAEGSASVGGTPYLGVYDPSRGQVDLVNTARSTLDVLDDGSNALVHSSRLGSAPMASVYDSSTDIVYVADASVSVLEELDARTDALVGTIALPAPGIDLAFGAPANILAVVLANGGVAFVNPGSSSVQSTWRLTNGTLLLHAVYGNGEFFVSGGLPTGPTPYHDVFIFSASGFALLSCVGAGRYDNGLSYDANNRDVYVATDTTILVVNSVSNDRLTSYALPSGATGDGIAYLPYPTNALLVSDWALGVVHVYNLTLNAFDADVPAAVTHPGMVTFVPQTGTSYVAEAGSAFILAVIDHGAGSYSTSSAEVGLGPSAIGFSSLSGLLYVTNAASGTISLLQVAPAGSVPMVASLSIVPATVAFGSSLHVDAAATYPAWNDSFSYSGLPPGCPSRNSSSFSCTPTATGSFPVTVTARNPYGVSASATANLAVFAPLTIVSFQAVPDVLTVGVATHVTLSAAGGVIPLTVGYPVRPPGCGATNSTNWTCTPTAAGNFTLEVTISDSGGNSVGENLSLVVNPRPAIVSFAPSVNSTTTGTSVDFTVVVSGGTAPLTYSYAGLPAGCTSANTSRLTCTPSAAGDFTVVVTVVDAVGVSVIRSAVLNVTAPVSPGGGGKGLGSTDLLLIGAIVAIVVAVALVAVLLILRRRRAAPSPEAPASPSPESPEGGPEAEGPEVRIMEAPPPEPILPPTFTPTPRPPPPRPRAPEPEEEAPLAPPPTAPAPAGTGRPPLVCGYCGTVNEPWLTVCRKCKRALLSTGSR